MRTTMGFVAALALLAACGAGAGTRAPVAPAPDEKAAIAEARGLAQEIASGLAHGNPSGLAPLCAADLIALGPRAGDGGRSRTDTLVALGDVLAGGKHKLKVRDQRIDSAAGARSAWLTEDVDVDGKRHAVTAIVADVDGLWVVTAVNVGARWSERALRDVDGAGGARPPLPARPRAATATTGTGGNQPPPAELTAALARAAGDVDARLAQLDGERAVVLGPGERAAWRGAKAIRKAWKKRAPRWSIVGEPQAGATPDGALAWIAASAQTIEASGAGHARRLFAVYRRDRDARAWRLVVLHESVAR